MAIELKQEQKQILSQKMIQSSSILQMSAADLEDYLNEQSLENPVIDLVQKTPEQDQAKNMETYQWISSHDEQNRYLYQRVETNDDEPPEWNMDTRQGESLSEYLWEQLLAKRIPAEYENDLKIIIDSLDEKGYFSEPADEFLRCFSMSEQHFLLLLTWIQSLEPAGVGARSLNECLCLQLERKGLLTEKLEEFVNNHLEQMAKNQLPAIAKELSVPIGEVKEYCALIRTLDPKPGAYLGTVRHTHYISPDVIIVKFKGHLDILLNETLYPDISLNTGYMQMFQEQKDKEVQAYLQKKIGQAEWIRQCIAQRNTTLFSVVREIVACQSSFFYEGTAHLKTLRMADIAEKLGLHESTVSRAVHQKFLQCTWGIFPLNYFFAKNALRSSSSSIFKAAGEQSETSTAFDIKTALKKIIEGEDKKKPYSDRILAEKLEEQGFSISRRTVAKYREEENIPGASGRKEY